MHSADPRAIRRRPTAPHFHAGVQHAAHLRGRAGGRGGEDGGRAVMEMGAVYGADGVRRSIHVVGAACTVQMDIDEARRNPPAPDFNHCRAARGTPAAPHLIDPAIPAEDGSLLKNPVRQDDPAEEC